MRFRSGQPDNNGGIDGVRSFIGHLPGNIDWAVVFNRGRKVPGQPGEDSAAFKMITDAAGRIDNWPRGDLFPRLE